MFFLGIGIVLLLMKYFEVSIVATWSWWIVLAPFALAILWWEVFVPLLKIDAKIDVHEMEEKKKERIRKQFQGRK